MEGGKERGRTSEVERRGEGGQGEGRVETRKKENKRV